jgi:hypothetical protein
MSDLPPGFVLEGQDASQQTAALPPGFVMEGALQAKKPYSGTILPLSRDAQGNISFDSNAGLVGMVKHALGGAESALTLPGDVYQGNVSMVGPDGHTNPEVIRRSADLAALTSPVSPRTALSATATKAVIPTQEALETAASAGYDKARGLGVEISPQSVAQMGGKIGASLEEKGINGELAPKTFSILNKVTNPPADSVATISNLETIRRSLGHAAGDFTNPTEQLAAKTAQRHLDDYLASIPAQDVVRGPAAEASQILGDARGNYAAAKRSSQITDAYDAADLSSAAANSGQNLGNATRQRIKSILLNDKKTSGYSDAELAQMEKLVRGTKLGNASRYVGNLLGGGGGLGSVASAAVGAGAAGPIGATAPAVGYALKKLSDASVNRQARILSEMIRNRSPLSQTTNATVTQQIPLSKQAIVRALLLGQQQQ